MDGPIFPLFPEEISLDSIQVSILGKCTIIPKIPRRSIITGREPDLFDFWEAYALNSGPFLLKFYQLLESKVTASITPTPKYDRDTTVLVKKYIRESGQEESAEIFRLTDLYAESDSEDAEEQTEVEGGVDKTNLFQKLNGSERGFKCSFRSSQRPILGLKRSLLKLFRVYQYYRKRRRKQLLSNN